MAPKRVVAFVDGFNIYHALKELHQNHLKWLDLWKLCSYYAPVPEFQLADVYYFSAYATWRPDSYRRHQAYVRALTATGVRPVLGKFKPKTSQCPKCAQFIQHHEEKETDVNIALYLLLGAVQDWYDRALLVTRDSDLAPAVRMVVQQFPSKQVRIVTPAWRGQSMELAGAARTKYCSEFKVGRVKQCLLPSQVTDAAGSVVTRPVEYDP